MGSGGGGRRERKGLADVAKINTCQLRCLRWGEFNWVISSINSLHDLKKIREKCMTFYGLKWKYLYIIWTKNLFKSYYYNYYYYRKYIRLWTLMLLHMSPLRLWHIFKIILFIRLLDFLTVFYKKIYVFHMDWVHRLD